RPTCTVSVGAGPPVMSNRSIGILHLWADQTAQGFALKVLSAANVEPHLIVHKLACTTLAGLGHLTRTAHGILASLCDSLLQVLLAWKGVPTDHLHAIRPILHQGIGQVRRAVGSDCPCFHVRLDGDVPRPLLAEVPD